MNALRRLSILSLILGVGQVVFGAIVRITGSGLGCGDHCINLARRDDGQSVAIADDEVAGTHELAAADDVGANSPRLRNSSTST